MHGVVRLPVLLILSSGAQLCTEAATAYVQVQVPGPVATTMVRVPRPESGLNPSPADFVKYAGRHIGYETACIPYPVHAIAMCAPPCAHGW